MVFRSNYLYIFSGIAFAVILSLFSCTKEGSNTIVLPTPISSIPVNVIPQQFQDSLSVHGMDIYEGNTPPSVEGLYLMDSILLQYASDNYNNEFVDIRFRFQSQNERGLIRYSEHQTSQTLNVESTPSYAHIIGHDSCFTVYCYDTLVSSQGDWWCYSAKVVSGIMTTQGIRQCQYALITLDKWVKDDIIANFLPDKHTYRIFYDGDRLTSMIQASTN